MFNPSRLPRSRLACALALAVYSWSAGAAGLGELATQSSLGSRLQAQVPVLGLDPADVEQLKASLAGVAAYEAMGLEFPSVLFNVRVEVSTINGVPTLLLSSRDLVTEPILDVVLALDGPGGKVQRHYTLLLDLPADTVATGALSPASTVVSTEPAAVTSVSATAPSTAPVAATVPAKTPPRKRPVATKVQVIPADALRYGPVRPGESLWTIASALRKRYGLKQQAMMDQIVASNPQAFVNGNEDLLRAGAELSLPAQTGAAVAELATSAVASTTPASATQAVAATTVAASAAASTDMAALSEQNQQLRQQLTALSSRIAELEQRLMAPELATEAAGALTPIGMSTAAPEPVASTVAETPTATEIVPTEPVVAGAPELAATPDTVATAPVATEPVAIAPVATPPVSPEAVAPAVARIETGRATVKPVVWIAAGALGVAGLAAAFWWYRRRKVEGGGFDDQSWMERKRLARENRHLQQQGLMDSGVLANAEVKHREPSQLTGHDAIDIKLQYVRSAVDTFMMFQRYREALSFLRREISEAGGVESPLGQRIDALLRDIKGQMDSMGVSEEVPDGSVKPALASERSIDDERSVVTPLRQRNRLK